METITSKEQIRNYIETIRLKKINQTKEFVGVIDEFFLQKKIKFPLLEFASKEMYQIISEKNHIKVCDDIVKLHRIGGNVFLGIILQLRLKNHFVESHKKAIEYIIIGNQWYVCDIIGERVMGYSLLMMPDKTIPMLKKNTKHLDKWIVRSVGVATHYAVKKGLQRQYVKEMFELLLTCSNTTDFHTKKGIGWAVKTISKFHPDIVAKYKTIIESDENVKQWFKSKIKIGLGRTTKYASKYTS